METKKPPSVDSELFRKMGVSFVKIENEDGTVRYKPKYAYKVKAEEAKKELLERHQKKEHLTLKRHPGDTARTALWSCVFSRVAYHYGCCGISHGIDRNYNVLWHALVLA